MKYSIYGRFELSVERRGNKWLVFQSSDGKRTPATNIVIPDDCPEQEIPDYLDAIFHELARPGDRIAVLA